MTITKPVHQWWKLKESNSKSHFCNVHQEVGLREISWSDTASDAVEDSHGNRKWQRQYSRELGSGWFNQQRLQNYFILAHNWIFHTDLFVKFVYSFSISAHTNLKWFLVFAARSILDTNTKQRWKLVHVELKKLLKLYEELNSMKDPALSEK